MAIKQGQTLTKDDLNAFFYVGGSLSDPFWATYTLYDSTTGSDQIIGLPDRTPIKYSTGSYYAPWSVPDDEPIGRHKITWKYKENSTSEIKIETEEFEILSSCAGVAIQYPPSIMFLITQLRVKLRDIDPDRDYSIDGNELITIRLDDKYDLTLKIKELYEILNEKKK